MFETESRRGTKVSYVLHIFYIFKGCYKIHIQINDRKIYFILHKGNYIEFYEQYVILAQSIWL